MPTQEYKKKKKYLRPEEQNKPKYDWNESAGVKDGEEKKEVAPWTQYAEAKEEKRYLRPDGQTTPKYDWNEAAGVKDVEEKKEVAPWSQYAEVEEEKKYIRPESQAKQKYDWNEAAGVKDVEEKKEVAPWSQYAEVEEEKKYIRPERQTTPKYDWNEAAGVKDVEEKRVTQWGAAHPKYDWNEAIEGNGGEIVNDAVRKKNLEEARIERRKAQDEGIGAVIAYWDARIKALEEGKTNEEATAIATKAYYNSRAQDKANTSQVAYWDARVKALGEGKTNEEANKIAREAYYNFGAKEGDAERKKNLNEAKISRMQAQDEGDAASLAYWDARVKALEDGKTNDEANEIGTEAYYNFRAQSEGNPALLVYWEAESQALKEGKTQEEANKIAREAYFNFKANGGDKTEITQEEDEIKYLMPGSQTKPKYDWNVATGGNGVEEKKEVTPTKTVTPPMISPLLNTEDGDDYQAFNNLVEQYAGEALSEKEREKRERAAVVSQGIGALGNAISAFSNIASVGGVAPSQKLPELPNVSKDIDNFRAYIDRNKAAYVNAMMNAGAMKRKDRELAVREADYNRRVWKDEQEAEQKKNLNDAKIARMNAQNSKDAATAAYWEARVQALEEGQPLDEAIKRAKAAYYNYRAQGGSSSGNKLHKIRKFNAATGEYEDIYVTGNEASRYLDSLSEDPDAANTSTSTNEEKVGGTVISTKTTTRKKGETGKQANARKVKEEKDNKWASGLKLGKEDGNK